MANPAWLTGVLLLWGCASATPRGIAEFRDARYPEALGALLEDEGAWASLSREQQGRYALYRGLSHLALGDGNRADSWLTTAHRLVCETPDLLAPDEIGSLEAAWRTLGRLPGDRCSSR